MKAFQIQQFGLDNLRQVEVPRPVPGAGQVLVRVHAASLNYRDLVMVRGHYDPRLHMPRIPLSDGVGEIVETGPGVTRWRAGDRVIGLFLQNWLEGDPSSAKSRGALGGDIDGVLAEYIVLPEHGVAAFPAHLSYREAATLPCAALTAWNALHHAAKVKSGDNVVIQGTGGVSLFALQFALVAGARVLGTSGSDEKLSRAKKLGLHEGVNYKSHPQWAKWVQEQTDGQGADIVVEVGGSGTWSESLRAVRVGGTVAQIGILSGVEERIALTPILMRQIRIAGVYVGSGAMMDEMNRAIALHKLKPVIDRVFPFEETLSAYHYLEDQRHLGKVVIDLSGK